MRVGEIDVHDDEQVHAYWAAGKEGDEFGRPYAAYRSLEAQTIALREEATSLELVSLAARDEAGVLGIAEVAMPRLDNTHLAYLEVLVPPRHRRRGVGAALFDAALALARDRGRTTVIAEVNMPYDLPPRSAGSIFLQQRGFTTASLEIHRVLELPVGTDHLDTLETGAAPHHGGYRLVSFNDRVPDELLEGYCALQAAFNSQAPLGDLDLEPEAWDEARVRNGEARAGRMGRRSQATMALAGHDDGPVVALTEMFTNRHLPSISWQSGTLVLSKHRGHRLGLATKVANLRRFQESFPEVGLVHSWNAEENGPMVAINDTIGFRPVEYTAEMQRKL